MLVRMIESTESAVRIADILGTGLERQRESLEDTQLYHKVKIAFYEKKD